MLMEVDDSLPALPVTDDSTAGAPDADARHRIHRLVPHDPLFIARVVLMAIYGVVYIWWFRSRGLILDRISVGISVGIFLSCAFVGKPWRRWGILGVDAVLYATMWFCYEMTRGAADRLGFPYQVESVRNIDRVLFFGILGALVLRAVMILVGAWLIAQFHWVLYLFGAFLLFTGIKMWWAAGQEPDLDNNPALKWIRSRFKIAPNYDGEKFFTMVDGVKMASPLLVVILLIGIVDIVFAVDSIPAIFAITTDPFIVLTSNVFAILGLRAMYFLLANMHERFHLLSYGLAIVLVFIGAKMLLIDVYKIPVAFSLGFTAVTLAVTMVLSLKIPPKGKGGGAYPFGAKKHDERA
jgi:predicted tellurium resistance membrane protein TerC